MPPPIPSESRSRLQPPARAEHSEFYSRCHQGAEAIDPVFGFSILGTSYFDTSRTGNQSDVLLDDPAWRGTQTSPSVPAVGLKVARIWPEPISPPGHLIEEPEQFSGLVSWPWLDFTPSTPSISLRAAHMQQQDVVSINIDDIIPEIQARESVGVVQMPVERLRYSTPTSDAESWQAIPSDTALSLNGMQRENLPISSSPEDAPTTNINAIIGTVLRSGKLKCSKESCASITFGRHTELKRHYEGKHALSKPIWCNEQSCARSAAAGDRPFYRRDKLMDHVRKIHGRMHPRRRVVKDM